MAITDDQMDELAQHAFDLGRDGVLNDPSDNHIIDAVFDFAQISNMRTEDEFDAVITEDDMPAPQDRKRLLDEWRRGDTEYMREGSRIA